MISLREGTCCKFGLFMDNRPLTFDEFLDIVPNTIHVSATPGPWELEQSGGAVVEQIIRPTGLLDPEVEIRPGAFIRGKVIIGAGSVIGNSTEIKNSLLMEGVQAPHFNYVGDSILGNKAHLGAGVICANLRLDQLPVTVKTPSAKVDTGLRKLGAIMGDEAEAGCNAVLQPGAILGKRAAVMPTLAFAGYLEPSTIAFHRPVIGRLPRRD